MKCELNQQQLITILLGLSKRAEELFFMAETDGGDADTDFAVDQVIDALAVLVGTDGTQRLMTSAAERGARRAALTKAVSS